MHIERHAASRSGLLSAEHELKAGLPDAGDITPLHGDGGTVSPHRVPETFTALFAAWAVLVVVTFLHPANAKAEMFSRVMGIIASVVFALKGDVITDYVIRLLGAGAGIYSLILMFVLAAGLLIALWVWRRFANEAEADATDTAVKTTT